MAKLFQPKNFFSILMLTILSACSSKTESSSVKLNFPDWAALQKSVNEKAELQTSSARDLRQIEILAINITGPDLAAPILFSWHRKDGDQTLAPRSLDFTVPRGSKPLVQVLAVYGGEHSIQFLYGDDTPNVSTALVETSITLSLKNTTGSEGNIVGRYLSTATSGPTGAFDSHFDPDQVEGGKPSMIISEGQMFGGWVRAFMLDSRLVQYKWKNGQRVFDAADDDDIFSTHSPQAAARISVPRSYYDEYGTGAVGDLEESGARRVSVGYFGPGARGSVGAASPFRLCMPPGPISISNLYYSNTAINATNQVQWVGKTTISSGEAYKKIFVIPSRTTGSIEGGNDTANCTSGLSEFNDYLSINVQKFADDDKLIEFRGPFKKTAADKYVTTSLVSTGLDAAWSFLPGAETDLAGVSVFYRVMPTSNFNDNDIRGNDGYRCNEFRDRSKFTPSFDEIPLANNAFSTIIPNILNAALAARTQIVVCPRAMDGSLFSAGVASQNSGGVGGTLPATAGMKILGMDAGSDYQSKAMISSAGVKLSRKMFQDARATSSMFAPAINGQLIPLSDINSYTVRLGSGSPVSLISRLHNHVIGGQTYGTVKLDDIRAAIGPAAFDAAVDPMIYFGVQTATDSFSIPPIQLITSTCTSYSGLKLVRADATVWTATTMFDDMIASDSDFDKSYRLRYNGAGCEDISVPVDSVSISRGAAATCLSDGDIFRDISDPFKIWANPADYAGTNCSLNSHTIQITTPSSDPTDRMSRAFSSTGAPTLTHSLTAQTLGIHIADSAGASSLPSNFLRLREMISGPGNSYKFYAGIANADKQLTNRTSLATSANWAVGGNNLSAWTSSAPTSDSSAVLTTNVGGDPLSGLQLEDYKVEQGGLKTQFSIGHTSGTNTVLKVIEIWGSQLYVVANGSGARLYYAYRSLGGGSISTTLVDVTPPGGISSTIGLEIAASPFSTDSAATFAYSYNGLFRFGALIPSGGTVSSVHSVATILGGSRQVLSIRPYGAVGISEFAIVMSDNSGSANSLEIFGASYPTVTLSGISSPALLSRRTASVTASDKWLVPDCGDPAEIYAIRVDSSSNKIYKFSGASYSEVLKTPSFPMSATLDKVACANIKTNSTVDGFKVIAAYNSSAAESMSLIAYDSSPASCGSGVAGGSLSPSFALSSDTAGAFLFTSAEGFIFGGHTASSSLTNVRNLKFSCGGGQLNPAGSDLLGYLNSVPGKRLRGGYQAEAWRTPDLRSMYLFGENMQILGLDIR